MLKENTSRNQVLYECSSNSKISSLAHTLCTSFGGDVQLDKFSVCWNYRELFPKFNDLVLCTNIVTANHVGFERLTSSQLDNGHKSEASRK